MKFDKLLFVSLLPFATLAGCSSGEEYEVTGEVSSAETVSGPISLEFFEVDKADAEAERVSIHEVSLAQLGPVSATIEADPELAIIVVALADANDDGKCTEGELWGETELVKEADNTTIKPFTVELKAQACPAEPAAE
jgi:hypothetical protein